MAGGPNAQRVACMACMFDARKLTMATRVVEGVESDQYVCELGHDFGLDWRAPAETPQWPPDPELVEAMTES